MHGVRPPALLTLLTARRPLVRRRPQLLATRVGFAAAQATQNPICFSLIPELFPKNRTTAMAVYNTGGWAPGVHACQAGMPRRLSVGLGFCVETPALAGPPSPPWALVYCAPASLHLTAAAIYAGRALSFAALIVAGQLGVPQVSCGQRRAQQCCGTKGVLFACFAAAPPTYALHPVPGCCPSTPPHLVIASPGPLRRA